MLNIKESVKILFIVTVSVLTVGCKKHNAEYTSSENIGDVSSAVSETTAESEAVSSTENVTSTLSANVAQGSSTESSNIAKPDKTVSQVREQPKTSSAAPSNTDTVQKHRRKRELKRRQTQLRQIPKLLPTGLYII